MGIFFKYSCILGKKYCQQNLYKPTSLYISCLPKQKTVYSQYRMLVGTIKHNNKKDKPLSSTSVMLQDGVSILEMPCIVQIINGEFGFATTHKAENEDSSKGMTLELHETPKALIKNIDSKEEYEMSLGFIKCNSVNEIFNLLNTCPAQEITPIVASTILKRIFVLENDFKFRNQRENSLSRTSKEPEFTFTRSALIKRLIETICACDNPQVIVDTLLFLGQDPCTEVTSKSNYLEQICTESIILAASGKLDVSQVCQLIRAFHNLEEYGKDLIEKAWVGLNDKTGEMQENDLCNIMSVLPLIKKSRLYFFNIAEKIIPLVWYKLKIEHVIKILYYLSSIKKPSKRFLGPISKWTNMNIHTLTEGNLRWIISSFMILEYSDKNIQNAISRYMNAKSTGIKDSSLITLIVEYCQKMKIRHPVILRCGADYYIKHGKDFLPSQTAAVMNCFGYLNFTPADPQAFFTVLESQIMKKFSQFSPTDLLDMFLSCVYIKQYPMKFVNNIFNPHFFDRLQSLNDKEYLSNREKIFILDTVLTLESANYSGPFLPKVPSQNISKDARILRCIHKLTPILTKIVDKEHISQLVHIPALPALSLFQIDCVVKSKGKLQFSNFASKEEYAIMISLPEHYDITGSNLIGPQEMRKRIFEHFGFKVVCLDYQTLNSLFMHPNKLEDMLIKKFEVASK